MQLCEKYRPKTWNEVVGQDAAIEVIRNCTANGYGGMAYWISGGTGRGKTTIAKIIANEMADAINVEEIDGDKLDVETLERWEYDSHLYPMGRKPGRCYIINEAHGIRGTMVRRLLTFLETALPNFLAVIFTTTTEGQATFLDAQQDACPLVDRCTVQVNLAARNIAEPYAARCKAIAEAEGLNGYPIERYIKLAQLHHNSLRAMIQAVQRGEMKAK